MLWEGFGLAREEVDRARDDVLSYTEVVEVQETPEVPVRDADDAKVFWCALAGGAEYVVTGDRDLLSLERVGPVRVVSVRGFLNLQARPE